MGGAWILLDEMVVVRGATIGGRSDRKVMIFLAKRIYDCSNE